MLIGPAEPGQEAASYDDLDARLDAALAHHSIKDAAALVAAETGHPKREVYARAVARARHGETGVGSDNDRPLTDIPDGG